ncbi:MAG TPA: hypothetical protein VKY59_05385 [Spirillospora sp.]|jgi:ABC-type uncharacterized transport system permease subunit|nr:hypothetical protein [Spirillospora sp.]
MEQTWLNPDFATEQLIAIALVILGSLIVLPVVFGALIYAILTGLSRFNEMRRTRSRDHTQQEE